mmetsp:Transcript_53699/g.148936  ORF Transcript_53699/g.148936 Transcript_53699/m.148936 type:complete len:256 (+) Transcript_53699:2299-3066(+)
MNSASIRGIGLPRTLTSTLSRPRCGMPNTNSSTPISTPLSTKASRPGITASPPSIPKRFIVLNLSPKKRSKPSAMDSLSYVFMAFSFSVIRKVGHSTRCRIQLQRFRSRMCIYSMPSVPQYVERRRSTNSRRVMSKLPRPPAAARKPVLPPVLPRQTFPSEAIFLSMSFSLNPWNSGESSAIFELPLHWCCPNGSSAAASCPRTWKARMRYFNATGSIAAGSARDAAAAGPGPSPASTDRKYASQRGSSLAGKLA